MQSQCAFHCMQRRFEAVAQHVETESTFKTVSSVLCPLPMKMLPVVFSAKLSEWQLSRRLQVMISSTMAI